MFLDDCTKYGWLHPLTTKFHAFITFLKFKAYVENILSLKIKAFQPNGGGELTSTRFKFFFNTHIIEHRLSFPHTPKQNGAAERKRRHIVKMGLTLLATTHYSLPFKVLGQGI